MNLLIGCIVVSLVIGELYFKVFVPCVCVCECVSVCVCVCVGCVVCLWLTRGAQTDLLAGRGCPPPLVSPDQTSEPPQ